MRLATILITAAALTGCATFDPKMIENRVACTVAKDEAHVISKWGPVGITAKIADADRAVICK
jgi:hypothetical protein